MAKLIQVIEVDIHRGIGTPSDPHRTVRQYWTTDGVLLTEQDRIGEIESERQRAVLLRKGDTMTVGPHA